MPSLDVVYLVFRNSVDWSGPPPTFIGVGKTVREALSMGMPNKQRLVEEWIQEKDLEVRAYYSVRAYDMTVTPPVEMDRPDLQRGGGPVKDA